MSNSADIVYLKDRVQFYKLVDTHVKCDRGRFFDTFLLTRRTEYQGFTCG
jgi:hypothetical protein